MTDSDPRNPYVRARAALDEMIDQVRRDDDVLGADQLARTQHGRNARDLADLISYSETARDYADLKPDADSDRPDLDAQTAG